jgi:Zn-dependent protease
VPLDAIVWYVAFVLSTTAHEAAHALVAYLGGDPTAYHAGQVSLNPLPHMRREPFGMVVMPLVALFSGGWCLGWASTPYDPRWEQRHPRRAAWMAAAGPGANLLLASIAFGVLWLGLAGGIFFAPDSVSYSRLVFSNAVLLDGLGRFLSIMLLLNMVLFLLNLLPIPPLDGASAIGLVLSEDLALRLREAIRAPGIAIVALVLIFLGFGRIVRPLWRGLVELLHPGLYG